MKNSSFALIKLPAAIIAFLPLSLPTAGQTNLDPVLAPYAEEVEQAVEKGLQYLVSTQREDGSFPGNYGRTPGVVGLAGMSFLAAGYLTDNPVYGPTILRCLEFLLHCQRDNGYITARQGSDKGMYSHAIATLLFSELSGMVSPEYQAQIDQALPKALAVIISAQNVDKPEDHQGGWRYEPTSRDSDLSVSGWTLMALRSARINGARIPAENIENGVQYILNLQDREGDARGGFRYMRDRRGNNAYMTVQSGLAVLCLQLTGHHDSEEVEMGRRFMLQRYQRLAGIGNEMYGLYYYAQASFQSGGELWERFAEWMYERYLPRQRDNGSWPQEQNTPAYSTSMVLLSLTVPYRQLPIYIRDETVDE